MKKTLRIGTILLLAVALMLGIFGTALAEDKPGNVTFDGDAQEFIVVKGTDSNSDLFVGVSDLMPGDSVTEKILVKLDPKDLENMLVNIYLRADVPDEQPEGETAESVKDFLNQLNVTVKDGDSTIYSGKLSGPQDRAMIGAFSNAKDNYKLEAELTVEFSAPIEMGNEYANRKGNIDWVFIAEIVNSGHKGADPTEKPESTPERLPQTGQLWWPVGVLALLGLIFLVIAILRKRKQSKT